ncbi:MAG: TetR/AcrR family transcriptional regulator [Tabrizicola sp.]|jgi:AcrR family transcriptional regulator|nr:TetR/AcrR family transcriptional regulator [Tabrizicola sp.]
MKPLRKTHAESRRASRARLIAAARKVFATIGYDACTVRDIVRESGLAPGSYYNIFTDKEKAFEEILSQIADPFVPVLKGVRAQAKTPHDFVFFPFEACRRLPEADAETAAIITRNQAIFRKAFYFAGSQAQIRSDLVADLKAWQADGRFKPVDAEMMADVLIALGFDLVIFAALSPEEGAARARFLTDLFVPILAA